jgi:transcription elongation factor GreA
MSGTAVVEDREVITSGSTVVVMGIGETEEERYTIVAPPEAAPLRGYLSEKSPLARALMDHQAGENVRFRTPAGAREVRIVSVASDR